MLKLHHFLLFITILNLSILGLNFYIKKPSGEEKAPVLIDETCALKEDLFFQALPDQNKPAPQAFSGGASPRLILRFSHRNCEQCKVSALFEMERFSKIVSAENISVYGTFRDERDFTYFQQTEKRFKLKIENIPETQFGLQIEKSASYPFFFMLLPDGRVAEVFIPMKEDIGRTRRYLDIIHQKYFAELTINSQ